MVYKTILVPVDGSASSNAAARSAVAFAVEQGARVIGLHVAPTYESALADVPPESFPSASEHDASMRKKGAARLAVLDEAARTSDLEFTPVIAFSDSAPEAILETAERYGCDLIFMAGHGYGGWNPVMLGNTTQKVLSASPIPVLVYRAGQDRKAQHDLDRPGSGAPHVS